MTITKEDIIYVANLARLEVDDTSIETFAGQIGNILEYAEALNRVDTEGVPPTSHAIFLTNAFREDIESGHLNRDKVLKNAPEEEEGSFSVPKVVG